MLQQITPPASDPSPFCGVSTWSLPGQRLAAIHQCAPVVPDSLEAPKLVNVHCAYLRSLVNLTRGLSQGGIPCFAGFAAFGGSQSHFLPYLNGSLRLRLASWLCGSLFRRVCSLWGPTVSLSSLFFSILMHSLGDVWHPGSGVPCFRRFCSLWEPTVSLSSLS